MFAADMDDTSAFIAARKPGRSRLTNDLFALPGIDGRSSEARRFRDILHGLVHDIGGEQELTPTIRLLLRSAALQAVKVEIQQQLAITGGDVDAGDLTKG